ncbi:MAG: TIGR04255 family protein [Burkholderiales bacterium]
MPKPLPVKLHKEPLVEAVCELRVSPAAGALHSVLPGYLFAKFPTEVGSLENLPASALPDVLRQQEPALAHAPLIRLTWRQYFILVGARQFSLACKLPYPGWQVFKADIILLFNELLQGGLVHGIDRYSMKYVNFFPSESGIAGATSMMDWQVRIGDFSLHEEPVQVRVEVPKEDLLTVITVASPARIARPDGTESVGGVVDVDTICRMSTNDVSAFASELADRLDKIRLVNKQAFFGCLSVEAINAMEPVYDESK